MMSMQQYLNVHRNLIQCYFINSSDITWIWTLDSMVRSQHLINLTFYAHKFHNQSTFL
jgi:hypothetical protein